MVHLVSESRASDGSLRALADAAAVAEGLDAWLIVGGHMVNLHVLRAGIDVPLRATRDADLAIELVSVKNTHLIERLRSLGYDNAVSSNRFDREIGGTLSSIDLLVPSHSNQHRSNIDAGKIMVDGLPVLHAALARPPVVVDLTAELSGGGRLEVSVRVPDVVGAIAMKAFAYAQRYAARDAEDVSRLLEAAHAYGIGADAWPTGPTFKAAGHALSTLFDSPGRGLAHAASSPKSQARLRALTRALVGRQS
jgi:hypothetical protein